MDEHEQTTFVPTHRIRVWWGNAPDTTRPPDAEWAVLLDEEAEEDGVIPAYEEVDLQAPDGCPIASWTLSDGEWLCEGQATPGGVAGVVEVEDL